MRPTDMRNLLTALAATVLLAGCASNSSSSPSAAGASHQSTIPSGNPSDAHTSPPATASPAATTPPSALPTVAGSWIPAGATSATLTYTGGAGAEPITAHKTVTGATFERLSADLNQLTLRPPGSPQCNVLSGESTTITVSGSGRTLVFLVPGVACRGVRLTINGSVQPLLIGSAMLISQIRAIVGYTGMAHPLTGSTLKG